MDDGVAVVCPAAQTLGVGGKQLGSSIFIHLSKVLEPSRIAPLADRELVKFHLQSTFSQPDVTVEASVGVARLTRYGLGAFPVSAEIPAEDVTLTLDLAQITDAPELFKRR